MQRILLSGIAVLALTCGVAAQDTTKEPALKQAAPEAPAQAQGQAPVASPQTQPQNNKMPAPESAARSFTEDATGQVKKATDTRPPLENGVLPGASPDGQAAPAKFSEKNAAADSLPIMAWPLALTQEQRQKIYARVMASEHKAEANLEAEPATILPSTVVLHELPLGLADEAPALRGYKYVKLDDRVVIVSPPNRVVVGEITRDGKQPQ